MSNPFVHIELHTSDPKAAKAFYGELLAWKLEDLELPGFGTYTLIDVGEGTGGGMMKSPAPGSPPAWLAYIQVDDLDAAAGRVGKLGGKIVQPRTPAGEFGDFVVIQDPTGAVVGLYESKER